MSQFNQIILPNILKLKELLLNDEITPMRNNKVANMLFRKSKIAEYFPLNNRDELSETPTLQKWISQGMETDKIFCRCKMWDKVSQLTFGETFDDFYNTIVIGCIEYYEFISFLNSETWKEGFENPTTMKMIQLRQEYLKGRLEKYSFKKMFSYMNDIRQQYKKYNINKDNNEISLSVYNSRIDILLWFVRKITSVMYSYLQVLEVLWFDLNKGATIPSYMYQKFISMYPWETPNPNYCSRKGRIEFWFECYDKILDKFGVEAHNILAVYA